jgi:hypothetical protein|uniref:Uncharacterized protein n=1 Tax=Zea mays TaxID=4577 RepID=A0A804UAF4_MAIZE
MKNVDYYRESRTRDFHVRRRERRRRRTETRATDELGSDARRSRVVRARTWHGGGAVLWTRHGRGESELGLDAGREESRDAAAMEDGWASSHGSRRKAQRRARGREAESERRKEERSKEGEQEGATTGVQAGAQESWAPSAIGEQGAGGTPANLARE